MKKVLEVITLASSAEAFIGNQFKIFQATGEYEMHLICSWSERLSEFALEQNIRYQPVEISRQFNFIKDVKAIYQIAKYIRDNQIDIIIAHYFPKCSLLVTIANFFAGNRCKIIVAHGVLHDTMHGLMRKAVIWEQKFDVFFAKKVVCVSNSVARRRREDGIENESKQIILGGGSANGVEALAKFNPALVSSKQIDNLREQYGLNQNDFVIGFCGRLVHDKGVEELSGALRILQRKYPTKSIKLFVIGQQEKRDALSAETKSFIESDERVVLTGSIPYSDIQQYYMLMDILVLPSYREGFPTVVLEAGAMNVPAIVSRSTGCIDAIQENLTGIYTDITPDAIAQSIERCFDDAFMALLKRNTRNHIVANFDQATIGNCMLHAINDIARES